MDRTTELFTTFQINGDLFGIEVMQIQEVIGSTAAVRVPLAPKFVKGLINLRGQLATALGLRELFGSAGPVPGSQMSVVCKIDGHLVSLLVDSIGDVLEVTTSQKEDPPETLRPEVKSYIKNVYKLEDRLLSILDIDKLKTLLSPTGGSD